MRKILMMMLALLLASCPAACAGEEAALDEKLEEIAREQAETFGVLLNSEEFLNNCVSFWRYCDEDERELFRQIDFTDPRQVNILIRPEEQLELIRNMEDAKERDSLIEHAREKLCLMPLQFMREFYSRSWEWRMVCEQMVLQDAAILPELDGAAYVIQLYDPVEGVNPPMLVTAFATTEHPATLVHTEFVWDNSNSLETQLILLIDLMQNGIGAFSPEDAIIREYRPLPEVEATLEPEPTSVPETRGALADWLHKRNEP